MLQLKKNKINEIPEDSVLKRHIIPEDSLLKRHYLTHVQTLIADRLARF